MYSTLKEQAVRNYQAVLYFFTGFETLLVFAIGLGRYRSVLLLGLFYLLRAIVAYSKTKHKVLTILLAPSLLIALYLDVQNGQILPVFPHLSFLITIGSLVGVDALIASGCVYKVLMKWSDNALFKMCPRCKYVHRSLVEQCAHCSYTKNLPDSEQTTIQTNAVINIDTALAGEITEYRDAGFKQPTKKMLSLLGLHRNEFVLINLKVSPFRSYFKNGERSLASNMVLTTERIIFVHSVFFEKGWKMREDVLYDEIIEVLTTAKHVVTADEPVVSISTRTNNYEIYFISLSSYREKIGAIMRCIRRRRSDIKVTTDATYERL